MLRFYCLTTSLLLATATAQAQCTGTGTPASNMQVSAITATSATVTFTGRPAGGVMGSCVTRISYAYAGGSPVSLGYAMPLYLTGLQPGRTLTVSVVHYGNALTSAACCPLPAATITFTTAAAPLAVAAAGAAGALTLAPNPARTSATLTLAAPLPALAGVQVLDALGREVRQQALPARATTAVLDLAELPAGLYLVRIGGATARLVVE